jgi:hypothetical protein
VKVSTHFTLEEFAVSASRPDLVRPVPAQLVETVKRLAEVVLEPIRARLARPMTILSGYRPLALNTAVGGSVTSQHLRAQAADWHVTEMRAAILVIVEMVGDGLLQGAGQIIYYPQEAFIHSALASARFPRPTICVHWPEGRVSGYKVITPTLAGLNKLVPAGRDPNTARLV